jgi:hypothetical protein
MDMLPPNDLVSNFVIPTSSTGENAMLRFRRAALGGLGLTCALLASPQDAHAFELSGVWATQSDLCKLVFTRKGSDVVFAEMSDLYGSGFIINGTHIVGKAARCTIESTKQDGNAILVSAACATSIMNQNLKFKVNIIDDDNISREFEEVPGMNLQYSRCRM